VQTTLHRKFVDRPGASEVEAILRSCVHCGFCNATCPTYLELGDERDGPRGRIYLIKNLLETGNASANSRRHLDRCLTCRACETTCPSGVAYGRVADFGRAVLEQQLPRPWREWLRRRALRLIVPHRRRFGALLTLSQWTRPVLPASLRSKIPQRQSRRPGPATHHRRKVVLLDGCAQAAATPNTNDAAIRVLDRLGISAQRVPRAGCCGALSYHLSAADEARRMIRRNIDTLLPEIRGGAECIVSTASGCGAMLKDYGHIMADDPEYAGAATEVAESVVDLSEFLWQEDLSPLQSTGNGSVALHCPCTLTHSLGASDKLRSVLQRVGFDLTATRDDHLCCGSAGSYSILQPDMSRRLRDKKLAALLAGQPHQIVTANVGCQLHLATGSQVGVSHWIELLDQAL
jgi:glycolate oxidase iron-sulfur subunit